MTSNEQTSKMEAEAQKMSEALKEHGFDILQVMCLVLYETPEGPGMATVSTEEAPQSLRTLMLQAAQERK